MSRETYFEANRANWNDRVGIHVASKSYDVPGFLAGASTLDEEDATAFGDVVGKSLIHLQCHFGMDTLSWARLGARVTGLDFSPRAVEAARGLAKDAGLDARFVEANVYDAADALEGEQFDLVFTGVGALCWLPDIHGWANVVGKVVKPGGRFYIREFHPVLQSLGYDEPHEQFVIRYPYFERAEPMAWDDGETYTDNSTGNAIHHTQFYEWNHGIGETVTGLIDAGLRIDRLRELDWCDSQLQPWLVQEGQWRWALPEGRERLPLAYSILATKA